MYVLSLPLEAIQLSRNPSLGYMHFSRSIQPCLLVKEILRGSVKYNQVKELFPSFNTKEQCRPVLLIFYRCSQNSNKIGYLFVSI